MSKKKMIKETDIMENTVVETQAVEVVDPAIQAKLESEIAAEIAQSELDIVRLELEKAKKELEEQKHQIQLNSKRVLDDKELDICAKQQTMGNEMKAKKEALEQQRIYDSQMITGKFINMRAPGQRVRLTYCKHATDLAKWWDFDHNKNYTIPRGFADQINEHYARIEHKQKVQDIITNPDQPGTALEPTVTRHQLYAFVPTQWAA